MTARFIIRTHNGKPRLWDRQLRKWSKRPVRDIDQLNRPRTKKGRHRK